MFFLNQIGLLHILPTFVPLFAIGPAVLFALSRGWDGALLLISMALFCVGHFHPHLLDFGQPTIFPFHFVSTLFRDGLCAGEGHQTARCATSEAAAKVGAGVVRTAADEHAARPREILPAHLISTHPLNLFGLLYQLPLIATVWLVSLVMLPKLKRHLGLRMRRSVRASCVTLLRDPCIPRHGARCAQLPCAAAAIGKLCVDPSQHPDHECDREAVRASAGACNPCRPGFGPQKASLSEIGE